MNTWIKNSWVHLLLWAAMLGYFLFAPYIIASVTTKNGKPLSSTENIPEESNRIKLVVEDEETLPGDTVHKLYGWALMTPQDNDAAAAYTRRIVLVSDQRVYFFPVESTYRDPGPQITGTGVDLHTLGFSTLIEENLIKPGKYRIGIIFRNTATGESFYSDKPARYVVKTPNTFRFEKK